MIDIELYEPKDLQKMFLSNMIPFVQKVLGMFFLCTCICISQSETRIINGSHVFV